MGSFNLYYKGVSWEVGLVLRLKICECCRRDQFQKLSRKIRGLRGFGVCVMVVFLGQFVVGVVVGRFYFCVFVFYFFGSFWGYVVFYGVCGFFVFLVFVCMCIYDLLYLLEFLESLFFDIQQLIEVWCSLYVFYQVGRVFMGLIYVEMVCFRSMEVFQG